jgi:hypothetical protein
MHAHDDLQNSIIVRHHDYHLCLGKSRGAIESAIAFLEAAFGKSVAVLRYRRLEDFASCSALISDVCFRRRHHSRARAGQVE